MWWNNVETKPYGGYPQFYDVKITQLVEQVNPGGQVWNVRVGRKHHAPYGVFEGMTIFAAAGRVFEVLDTATEHAQDAGKPLLAPMQHGLAFQQVCMRYQPASRLVLHDITLEARVGEVVALVGMSGAGKTSLVHLIPRFYDMEHGCITIDGVDIRQVTLASLRAQIGIVSQDVVLFDDTLRHNILYGNLHATPGASDSRGPGGLCP